MKGKRKDIAKLDRGGEGTGAGLAEEWAEQYSDERERHFRGSANSSC